MSMQSSGSSDAENIKIYLRIRPLVGWEETLPPLSISNDPDSTFKANSRRATTALTVIPNDDGPPNMVAFVGNVPGGGASATPNPITTTTTTKSSERFIYDYVGGPAPAQIEVFEAVAQPLIENCLLGYNATIFAYGQTGSGKTFTMQGPTAALFEESAMTEGRRSPLPPSSLPILVTNTTNTTTTNQSSYSPKPSFSSNHQGIIPRTFEYLFERIAREQNEGSCTYTCKCSYVEIYNEVIYDLLDPHGRVCNLREDVRAGVFIEDCQMIPLTGPSHAHAIFARGAANRHVAETAMNRESSRSHSVFTLYIQSRKEEGDLIDVTESRFNLVDLAGSERQQLAGTTGVRLKEAGNINKSLLALSNVINALVELANGRPRHVHYRDSKLTFLLRDSLGGNAKTCIVANVSPAPACQAETLSTLRFAQRAKMIKNKAVVNKDIQGSYAQLQAEIRRLQGELAMVKAAKSFSKLDLAASLESLGAALEVKSGDTAAETCSLQEILQHALIHQSRLAEDLLSTRNQLAQLEEVCRRKDQQIQTERLIVKFRENTIKSLQRTRESHLLDDGGGGGAQVERQQLVEEVAHWRKLYDHHPDVTRFAYENMILRDRLARLDGGMAGVVEKAESESLRLGQYIDALTGRILMMEKEREGLLSSSRRHRRDDDDDSGDEEDSTTTTEESRIILQSERTELECRLSELQANWETTQSNLNDALKSLAEARAEIDRLQTEAAKRRRLEEDQEHQAQLAKWTAERAELMHTQERLQADLDVVLGNLNQTRSELQAHEQAKVAWEVERRQKEWIRQTERSNYEERIRAVQEESNARLEQTIEQLKGEHATALQDHIRQIARLTAEVERKTRQVADLGNEIVLLRENYEKKLQAQECTVATGSSDKDHAILALSLATHEMEKLRNRLRDLEDEKGVGVSDRTKAQELQEHLEKLQVEKQQMQGQLEKLHFQLQTSQQDNEDLLAKLESSTGTLSSDLSKTQADLATLRDRIASVMRDNDALQLEITRLRGENERLIQHQNLKQKLQYHVKIKQENNELKEENRVLREDLARLKRTDEL